MPRPVTLGLVLAGGLARRMGGGDKARIRIGGESHSRPRAGAACAAMHRHHPQCQWRSRALCRYGLPVVPDTVPGFRRPARRHPRRARLGGGRCTQASNGSSACRATVRFCRTTLLSACMQARGKARTSARLRALRRMASSRGRAVAGGTARRSAQALVEEDLRKIEVWTARHGVAIADWPAEPVRSVLQRQHARGRRRGRAHCSAAMRAIERLISRRRRCIMVAIMTLRSGRGSIFMRAFIIACVAAS